MDMDTLPYLKWRTSKALLFGSLDGTGVWGRMDTCVRVAESLHCAPDIVNQLNPKTK